MKKEYAHAYVIFVNLLSKHFWHKIGAYGFHEFVAMPLLS